MATFWDRFYELLIKRHITGNRLANELGISNSNITFWKQGSVPNAELACKVAEKLNTTVEYLVMGKQEEIPKDVSDMACEILNLPPMFQNLLKETLELYKKQCLQLQVSEKTSAAGIQAREIT